MFKMKRILEKNEFYLSLVILTLITFLIINTDSFLTPGNITQLLTSYSFLGIMAAGMLLVIISGGIDLSFTAVATVAQYITALFIINYGGNPFISFLIGAAIGTILGIFNALLIYFINVHPLVVTIATLNIYSGFIRYFSKGKWLYNFPDWWLKPHDIFVFERNGEYIFSISLPVFLFILTFVIIGLLLKYSTIGRMIYAIGGNEESLRRLGFNLFNTTIFIYGLMGFLAGIASVSQILIIPTVAPNAFIGKELDVIAAVVLGGASITGGEGSALGTFLGVLLIALISNAIVLLGISSYWYQVILGTIIVISVSITAYNSIRNTKKEAEIDVD